VIVTLHTALQTGTTAPQQMQNLNTERTGYLHAQTTQGEGTAREPRQVAVVSSNTQTVTVRVAQFPSLPGVWGWPKRFEYDRLKSSEFLPCPDSHSCRTHRGTRTRQEHLPDSDASFHNNLLVFQRRKVTDSLSQCLGSLHSVTIYTFVHLGGSRMRLTTV